MPLNFWIILFYVIFIYLFCEAEERKHPIEYVMEVKSSTSIIKDQLLSKTL